MSSTDLAPLQSASSSRLLPALRTLEGRGTVGDVVASTGLPRDLVEADLRALLETHRGHLDVSDSGEVVYLFDPKLIRRDRLSLWTRARSGIQRFVASAFRVWIALMLVVYFALFVALVLAAIAAMLSRGDDNRGGGRGRGLPRGRSPINPWLLYYLWSPRWRIGRPYYGRRWERTLDKEDRVPFYKKVFAFVFGPDRPEPTRLQLDRSTLRLIRARNGVLAPAELVQHTALQLPAAEEEMGRLLGAYAGEPAVSEQGELVYVFPELMASAHEGVRTQEPPPAWNRLEYPVELTGNERKTDALIAGIGGFNLLAGATAPWFIFPQLGLSGAAAWIGLVFVPVLFSMLFLSVPALRWAGVKRENRARRRRNLRRVLLARVFEEALAAGSSVTAEEAFAHATRALPKAAVTLQEVEAELQTLSAEFDADVVARPDGALAFRFPAVRRQFAASEAVRRRLKLEERRLGEIVFSTEDDSIQASERDLASFDRELAIGSKDLQRYLPPPDRVGFEDEFELVAFDEELKQGAVRRR